MRQAFRSASWGALAWLLIANVGCVSGPGVDNPVVLKPNIVDVENPVLIRPGDPSPMAYAEVFEKVLAVLDDYFEIAYANRYDGRIETHPRIAPGFVQFWKPSTPDRRERLLAMLQSMRHRCVVQITAAEIGGFRVQVTVYRELQDLPRPMRAMAGAASFREAQTVDRQFQIVDPATTSGGWIPKGRDHAFEEAIIQKLRECQ